MNDPYALDIWVEWEPGEPLPTAAGCRNTRSKSDWTYEKVQIDLQALEQEVATAMGKKAPDSQMSQAIRDAVGGHLKKLLCYQP